MLLLQIVQLILCQHFYGYCHCVCSAAPQDPLDEFDSDETWLRKLAAAGFSEDDIKSVVDVVNDRCWIDDVICRSDGYSFAWGLVNKLYCNTWFSQDYVNGIVRTSLGCMAGTPPADIIYALTFSRVLAKFNDALDAKGLRSSLSSHVGPTLG